MNIQFYISVTGAKSAAQIKKEVAEIVAYRDALQGAGIECNTTPQRPAIARIASPTGFSADKSADCLALEQKWEEMTGKGFRCSPEMALMFTLPDDRAGRIARMIELVQTKQAVRSVSGWLPSGLANGGKVKASDAAQQDDAEETF